MGGAAFHSRLGKASFPRLPPAVYRAVKGRLLPRISQLYSLVVVPQEAPGKNNYGDLDFLVACPQGRPQQHHQTTREICDGDVPPHATVQAVLGAKHVIPMDGPRTSNYAVPVLEGEWEPLGHKSEEMEFRAVARDREIFYQVDVHVCQNEEEWRRIKFFHSYGDMGMMLGLVARNAGLRLGQHGLKIPIPNHEPMLLSSSFDEILPFLGLDKTVYDAGFQSKKEIFRWVASTRFFNSRTFQSSGPGISKVKEERTMYGEFVTWVHTHQSGASDKRPSVPGQQQHVERKVPTHIDTLSERTSLIERTQLEALMYFSKKEEFETLERTRSRRARVRQTFCGAKVREWTELGENWKGVKGVMEAMRTRMGGEDGILVFLDDREKGGEGRLRKIAIQVRDELKLSSPR